MIMTKMCVYEWAVNRAPVDTGECWTAANIGCHTINTTPATVAVYSQLSFLLHLFAHFDPYLKRSVHKKKHKDKV